MKVSHGSRVPSLLFLVVFFISLSGLTAARRSRESALAERGVDARAKENAPLSEEGAFSDDTRRDISASDKKEGNCQDCLQAPVINIRVTTGSRRQQWDRRWKRRHGNDNSPQSDDEETSHKKQHRSRGRLRSGRTDGRRGPKHRGRETEAMTEPREPKSGSSVQKGSARTDSATKDSASKDASAKESTPKDSAPKASVSKKSASRGSRKGSSARKSKSRDHSQRDSAPKPSAPTTSASESSRKHSSARKSKSRDYAQRDPASAGSTPEPASTTTPAEKEEGKKDSGFSWSSIWSFLSNNEDTSGTDTADPEEEATTTEEISTTSPPPTPDPKKNPDDGSSGPSGGKATPEAEETSKRGHDRNEGSMSVVIEGEATDMRNTGDDKLTFFERTKDNSERVSSGDDGDDGDSGEGKLHGENVRHSKKKGSGKNMRRGRRKSKTDDADTETSQESDTTTLDTTEAERKSSVPELHGSRSYSSRTHDRGSDDLQTHEPRSHSSHTDGTQRHGSRTSDPRTQGSPTHNPRTQGSRTHDTRTQSSRKHAPQGHGPQTHETRTHGSDSHDPTSLSTRSHSSHRYHASNHESRTHRPEKERPYSFGPPSAQIDRTGETDRNTSSRILSSLYPEEAYQGQWIDSRARYGSRARYRPSPGGRGRAGDRGDFVNRPAAADRLEQRLFPRLVDAADRLMKSASRVVGVLSNGLQVVQHDNDFIFNGTRYSIMLGVRDQLKEIAKANDMVYDTVLRSTLLTKDIYLRAHRGRLTGPTTRSLARPEMSLPSLYEVIQRAYDEERTAMMKLREVKGLMGKGQKVEARMLQVREKFQDDFARNDLRTLVYYINSTAQKLNRELMYSTRTMHTKRNQAILYASRDNVTGARSLLMKAGDFLATGSHNYRGNYMVVQDWKRQRLDDGGVGPPVSFRQRPPTTDVSPDDEARIRSAITRMQRHAQEQERLALEAERVLRPSILLARGASNRDDAKATAQLAALASRIETDGKKLYAMLDSIRVLIGAKQELRWVMSADPGACREGDDGTDCLTEGSGDPILTKGEDDEEGSGPLGVPTDDEDFVFVDEKQPPKRRPVGPTSLVEFSQKLSVHVDGLRLRSSDVLQRADQLYEATDELSRRWADVKETADMAERARNGWREVQQLERNVTRYVDDISDMTKVFNQEVAKSHDNIQTRMQKAVEIAERKLAQAQARKSGNDAEVPETTRMANDDSAVIAAFEKVNAVRDNQRAIAELRAVAPRTCGRVSSRLESLHVNISLLRQQVQKAKVLLQSLQLSVSKTGSGFVSIPTLADDHTPSLTTTVAVCIKTTDTDGPVLLVKGNNSATFSLAMDDRQLKLTVFDAQGYNLNSVTSDLTLTEDKWYNVKVNRNGRTVALQVTSKDGAESSENDMTISSLSLTQSTPIHTYIGGVPGSEPFSAGSGNWKGCLGGLRVNTRALSLMHTSSEGEAPKLCTDQCSPGPDEGSLVFDGAGFLHFAASVLPMRRRMESVHFRFRSRQSSAALIHLVNQRQRFLLRVVLTDGAIMIDTTTPTESIILRSRSNYFNDRKFHSLRVQYRDSTTYPEIDGKDNGFTIERSRPQDLNGMADGVVAGAFVTSSHAFEDSQYRPLIGCVQDLEIDEKPLSIVDAKVARGVFVGSCGGQSLWSGCVNFSADSSGIDLGTLTHSGTVVILFSPEARGPLVGYAREGRFEAEISLTDEGITVTTEENDITLVRPDDVKEDFSMLTIQDGGKTVTYSAWGKEGETTYGGFWDLSADVNGPHQITVAMPLESSDRQLVGAVAQLIVGKRYIDFGNYTLSNNLSACKRPLPDFVTSEVLPEATPSSGSPDSESTCSRDIRC